MRTRDHCPMAGKAQSCLVCRRANAMCISGSMPISSTGSARRARLSDADQCNASRFRPIAQAGGPDRGRAKAWLGTPASRIGQAADMSNFRALVLHEDGGKVVPHLESV